jgi:hypothetical protein
MIKGLMLFLSELTKKKDELKLFLIIVLVVKRI